MSREDKQGDLLASFAVGEDMSEVDWAQMMQDEQPRRPPIRSSPSPPRRKFEPPFNVVVRFAATEEDIYFMFGGKNSVKSLRQKEDVFLLELHDEKSMNNALSLNGDVINNQTVNVLEEVRSAVSSDVRMGSRGGAFIPQLPLHSRTHDAPHISREDSRDHGRGYQGQYQSHNQHDRHHDGGRGGHQGYGGYERRGGFEGRGGYDRGYDRGGYRGRGRNYDRGGYDNNYDRGHGGQQRYNRAGPIQRTSSYTNNNDYHHPAPVGRSRTESTSSHQDHRFHPRNSNNREPFIPHSPPQPVVPPVKKPTHKDLFGDAKPVDVSKKLIEVDEKLEAQRREEKKKREEEEKRRREEEERKRREEDTLREEQKRKEEMARQAAAPPIQIIRRPHNTESTDKSVTVEGTKGEEEKEEKEKKGLKEELNKNTGEKKGYARTVYKSQSTTFDGTRGRGRGGRGKGSHRGGRGNNSQGGERRNSYSGGKERMEKKKESEDRQEKEKDESRRSVPLAVASFLPPTPTVPPASQPSTPLDDHSESKLTSSLSVDGEDKRKKKEKKKETKVEEVKTTTAKPPTPSRKKKNANDKSKFASGNKFAALVESQD